MTRSLPGLFALLSLSSCVFHVERDRPPQDESTPELELSAANAGSPPPYHVGFLLGYRELDDEDLWDPVEDQFALGVEFVVEPPEFLVGWEFGLAASGWTEDEDDVDVNGSVSEIYGGLRKTVEVGSLRPYVGGGVSLFSAETRSEEDFKGGDRILRDDDGGVGAYWHAGVLWPVGDRAKLGFDYRMMTGPDVDLFRADGDADYAQLSLVLTSSF